MTSVKENLIAARALIDTPEKWLKEEYSDFNLKAGVECFCVAGALAEVYGQEPCPQVCEEGPEYEALREALPAGQKWLGVIDFNDHPDTTHPDILALFDRAISVQDATP